MTTMALIRAKRELRRAVRRKTGNVIQWRYLEPRPPGEGGTRQTINERLFYALVAVIGAGAAVAWLYIFLRAALVLP